MIPRYLAPITWYRELAHSDLGVYDLESPVTKRDKYVRRATILDTRGEVTMTIPVEHAPTGTPLDRLVISGHGNWHRIHRLTIEAAYGRTPFFEHYYPLLSPLISENAVGRHLLDLILDLDATIRHILGLTTPVTAKASPLLNNDNAGLSTAHYQQLTNNYWRARPYPLPLPDNLSILDLLFNIGPDEALNYLLRDY
ncbi:MAG: WbqC family protein [Muribaculaceae bacterium]|nr:WbqC family protein [Muribaculaceae bacterium]MBO5187529.1 WbqC family protein [Prevotella sp.]